MYGIIVIGFSNENIKTIDVDINFSNGVYIINKHNWITHDDWNDTFEITINNGQCTCRRTDLNGGWGMHLVVKCLHSSLLDLSLFEKKIFSQNGEDGITMTLIELIYNGNNDNKFYVEFGVENGRECNTRILREKYNWNGLQMDGGNENDIINLRKEFITKENILELFRKYNVPQNINILSVDIDFNDFYCLKEILDYHRCDIIICEYNATHLANEDKIIVYDINGGWDGCNYFGASLLSLDKLGKKYNYSLIYCDKKGVNCFFIHNDIIKHKDLKIKNMGDIEKIYNPPRYGNGPNGGHLPDPYNRRFISFEEAIQ